MTTEAQLRDELNEARQARRLKNDLLGDFFKEKEQLLFNAIQDTKIGDAEALVNIHHQLKSLNALRQEIETIIDTGKLAQAELNQQLDKVNN